MTTAELVAAGLTGSAIGKRVARDALRRWYAGVYSYGPGDLSREAEWMAAVLAAGGDAVLSHRSAAALWEIWRGVLDRAIGLYIGGSAGTKSRNEDAFLALLRLAGLPEPLVNVVVAGEEVDCHWPDRRLVVEVDGPGHARPTARRTDARKTRALTAAGYAVLRVTDVTLGSETLERL